jgi:hypothetical protein
MEFIGVKDNVKTLKVLATKDPCFGKEFAKSASECKACVAPVAYQGKVHLLKEICAMLCNGAQSPVSLRRLTSSDVRERIEKGASMQEIFEEILADNDPAIAATEARALLYQRVNYIKKSLPVPNVPTTEELLNGE